MTAFFDRLEAARRERQTVLCVGIDPRVEMVPEAVRREAGGDVGDLLERFGLGVLDAVAEAAACVKVNVAFYEAHGLAGMRAYAATLRGARERGIPVVADVKRGDLGSTAEAYARAHLAAGGDFEADAITVNPYLGADALEPFVRAAHAAGKGIYVLVRTSNPGAADLQDLDLVEPRAIAHVLGLLHAGHDAAPAAEALLHPHPLYERVAALVRRLGEGTRGTSGLTSVGAVVGATAPRAGAALRGLLPDVPFLVPGFGAQGASAADAMAAARPDGSGVVVNASRSVTHPPAVRAGDVPWTEAVARAAARAREELHGAVVGT